jgi:glycosyltransferase involved in cell wall biosynthesis
MRRWAIHVTSAWRGGTAIDMPRRTNLPLVSVIVPTAYSERGPRLQSALASIWAATGLGEQFELEPIVVDDASAGGSEHIAQLFPGTKHVRLNANRGLPGARNAGLAEATGKYVTFLDDDDLWMPNRLSDQIAAQEQASELEVVYSQHAVMRGDQMTGVFPSSGAPSGWLQELALKGAICPLQATLVPRAAIDKVGEFDESLSVWEDQDYVARLALFFPFRYLDGVVALYLRSLDPRTPQKCRSALLKRKDTLLAVIPEQTAMDGEQLHTLLVATTAWNAARYSYRIGDIPQAHAELLQGLEEFPALERDEWALSRLNELIALHALASESPVREIATLCAELQRTRGESGLLAKLRMRRWLSDIWSAAAMALASDGNHGARTARAAAMRSILLNPLAPLDRPGLVRLLLRSRDG